MKARRSVIDFSAELFQIANVWFKEGFEEACVLPIPLTLVVSVSERKRIELDGNDIGTLDDTRQLISKLTEIFKERTTQRAYKEAILEREDFSDLPESERIEKTVYVKAHHSLKYREVVKLSDDLKSAGADPLGLQIDKDLFFTIPE